MYYVIAILSTCYPNGVKLEGVLFLKAFMSIVHERANKGANYCDKILRILQHLLNKI